MAYSLPWSAVGTPRGHTILPSAQELRESDRLLNTVAVTPFTGMSTYTGTSPRRAEAGQPSSASVGRLLVNPAPIETRHNSGTGTGSSR